MSIMDNPAEFHSATCQELLDTVNQLAGNELRRILKTVVAFSQGSFRASWEPKNAPNWWREGERVNAYNIETIVEPFCEPGKVTVIGQRGALIMFCTSRIYFEQHLKKLLTAQQLQEVAYGKNPYPPNHDPTYCSEIDSLENALANLMDMPERQLRETLVLVVRHSQRTKRPSWDANAAPNWWSEGDLVSFENMNVRIEAFGPLTKVSVKGMQAALAMFYRSRIYFEKHLRYSLSASEFPSVANGKNPYPPKNYASQNST